MPCRMRARPSALVQLAGVTPSKGAALKPVMPTAIARRATAQKPAGVRSVVARLMFA